MPKNVIFCADGTWNGPSEPDNASIVATNVFKLFLNIDGTYDQKTMNLQKEQEKHTENDGYPVQQAVKYIDGVGDSSNFLIKILGGANGAGFITRIVRGYTFISRNYCAGDSIYIVGFSRGAYTARALAGLIGAMGLLDATKVNLDDRENAYRLGSAVWYQHLKNKNGQGADWLGRLQLFVNDLPGFLSTPVDSNQLIKADIDTVAVWDTVGSLGIPDFNSKLERVDAFKFADTKLGPTVLHGIHAVSVDEQRADFAPTLWDPDERVIQVLFPGAHSDVGGGYPVSGRESGISDASLMWMVARLGDRGVRFSPKPTYKYSPDPLGVAHQPWADNMLLHRPRAFPSGLKLTRCLLDRRSAGPTVANPGANAIPYLPMNLSDYFAGNDLAPGVTVA